MRIAAGPLYEVAELKRSNTTFMRRNKALSRMPASSRSSQASEHTLSTNRSKGSAVGLRSGKRVILPACSR
ncbi:hypothetical protein D9M71_706550 [compost metagenome]